MSDPRAREVRLVGRGGQGVVTAGELLGAAAVEEGRWAQSIPTFGPERRGALCTSTLRLAPSELRLKCAAATPDVVLILDMSVCSSPPVLAGLRPGATLVVNSPLSPAEVAHKLFPDVDFAARAGPGLIDMGLHDGATLLFSTPGDDDAEGPASYRIFTVDATSIALEALGRPIVNTAMMGAFAGATGMVRMDSIEQILLHRFGARGAANFAAARTAHERLTALGG